MTILLYQNCLEPSLKEVAYPVMALIEPLGIDTVQLLHAYGEISIGGINEQVIMLSIRQ